MISSKTYLTLSDNKQNNKKMNKKRWRFKYSSNLGLIKKALRSLIDCREIIKEDRRN